jgi:hypothetical protein
MHHRYAVIHNGNVDYTDGWPRVCWKDLKIEPLEPWLQRLRGG